MKDPGTRIVLIRHAHVDASSTGARLCGWWDLPLSPRGHLQLSSFADQNRSGLRFDALYTSSLQRSKATAFALEQASRLNAKVDSSLREIFCGELEGALIADIQRDRGELWSRNASQNENDFAWPGGESYQQFRDRVLTGLTRIAGQHPFERVAVVTHAGVITQVMGTLLGRPPAAWAHHRADPFTATEIVWGSTGPAGLVSFNVDQWWRESTPPAG